MSFVKRHARLLAVAVGCLGVGAGASAIASAGASTPSAKSATAKSASVAGRRGAAAVLRRAVHGDLVVHTRQGFTTVTFDRGFVQSVSGDTLTLREGTRKATYKTITLTIPSSARVRNDGQRSSLSSLRTGEHVGVFSGPIRTLVVARSIK
jgi:hypothetical protein